MRYINFELKDEKDNEVEGMAEADGEELIIRVEGVVVATVGLVKNKIKITTIKQSGLVDAEVVALADPEPVLA